MCSIARRLLIRAAPADRQVDLFEGREACEESPHLSGDGGRIMLYVFCAEEASADES
jgi:hypothetical protein